MIIFPFKYKTLNDYLLFQLNNNYNPNYNIITKKE